ncbi:MAG: Ig-like domain-containing protein [Hyphomicrobiaceae bacterium]
MAGSNGGVFTILGDGQVTFDPAGGFEDLAAGETRTSSIAYTVSDGQGGTDTAVVTVTVTGVNDAPVVVDPATGLAFGNAGHVVKDQAGIDSLPIRPLDVSGVFADPDGSDHPDLLGERPAGGPCDRPGDGGDLGHGRQSGVA